MQITLITEQGKRAIVSVPRVPRVGEEIAVANMEELYTEGRGESAVWIVTRVQWHYEAVADSFDEMDNRYQGCAVYIKNEDDE